MVIYGLEHRTDWICLIHRKKCSRITEAITRKIKIKKALKESYTLLKVIGNKKNAEKKDIRVKTNVKAYLEIGLERLTGSSNKQKITI